jgi:hypothetical protein
MHHRNRSIVCGVRSHGAFKESKMRIFLGIVVISLAAWVMVALYRAISCAHFNRALRAQAPSSQELETILFPRRSDRRGYAMTGGRWEGAPRSRRPSQRERRSA